MTDDEIRERIRAKRVAWLKATKVARDKAMRAYFRRVLGKFLGKMKAGKVYSVEDIEVLVTKSGGRPDSAGNALTRGVQEGYLDRVGWGRYVVTGKKLEE